ncbi:MAG: glycoside hydrolase family 26 protein [Micromonosporaceae bacterium]
MLSRRSRARLRVWMFLCGATMIAACAYSLGSCTRYVPRSWRPAVTASARASAPRAAYNVAPLLRPSTRYIGVAPVGLPHTDAQMIAFARRTGVRPTLVSYYTGWDSAFLPAVIKEIHGFGALPLVNLDSDKAPVAAIAAGRYDSYLKQFAHDIRKLNLPLALSFDHEFNGPWGEFGTVHTTHRVFVAAWRHVHDVLTRAGATNVIWVWMISNSPSITHTPLLRALWPGGAYVDWVGVDGYYTGSEESFRGVFGRVLTRVRHFTRKPFLITETSVQQGTHAAASVDNLFAGVERHDDIVGVVWFDFNKAAVGRQDWRLEDDPAALTAYRRAAARLGR